MTPNKYARCVLTDIAAIGTVLVFSLILTRNSHIPAALLIVQALAIELLCQAYPISNLAHDKTKQKLRPHIHVKVEIVAFGLLAGLVSYASYLLFFAYHVLSPVYIDTTGPLYMQATTVTFVTLALCLAINLLFVRADEHKHVLTDHLISNQKLLRSFAISAFLVLNVVYNPLLQSVLNTEGLGPAEWAGAILCAGVYALIRRLQRYTNKHSRHSLIKLHRELDTSR